MKTKLIKIKSVSNIEQWILFRTAGSAWLDTLNLIENKKNDIVWAIFYVKPWIVSFCLELFIKSIAAYEDKSFRSKKYSHNVTRILLDYKDSIPIFKEITNDKELFDIISEYEKTIDTKFGETGGELYGDEQDRLVNLINELSNEIYKK